MKSNTNMHNTTSMARNDKHTVTTRQLCFMLAFFLPANKIILLPSVLTQYAGNDLLLAALAVFVLQGAAIFALLWIMSRTEKTLFELIEGKFGTWAARIFYFILGAYLLFSSVLPVTEHRLYTQNTMYDTLPTILIFIPFFFFSGYAAAKGLQCAGRAADVSPLLFLVSVPVLLFMSVASADFTALLPIGSAGAGKIFNASAHVLSWCSDAGWVLVFLGNVRVEKNFLCKTGISYACGAGVVLLFLAVFYGIFSTVAMNESFAVVKIARYYNALKTLGRIDYLFIYILSLVQLFALTLPIQLSAYTMRKAFNADMPPLFSAIVNGVLLLVVLFTAKSFPSLERTINGYLFPVFLVFANALPLLCPLLLLGEKKARRDNNPQTDEQKDKEKEKDNDNRNHRDRKRQQIPAGGKEF